MKLFIMYVTNVQPARQELVNVFLLNNLLTRMNIFFEHELNELNEFFIKTCDSKIIRVIRIIRVQKNISGLYMLGVVL